MRVRGDCIGWLCLALACCVGDAPGAPHRGEDYRRRDGGPGPTLDAATADRGDAGRPPPINVALPDGAVTSMHEVPAYDLRAWMQLSDPSLVGVTVDPDNGAIYVLDANSGLYRLEDGGAHMIATLDDLTDPVMPADSRFTDLAACGRNRFLLTARNDGFMFHLSRFTFTRHFCYVPEILQEEVPDPGQITGAVGCDDTRIYAQPQTFDAEGFLIKSQVGVWDLETGFDLRWFDLAELEYLAGGLVVFDDDVLLLVRDDTYQLFHLAGERVGELEQRGSLRSFGIEAADGLAYDRANAKLLVLDGRSDRLHEIPVALLAQH